MDAVLGFSRRRKASRTVRTLSEIDALVDSRVLAATVSAGRRAARNIARNALCFDMWRSQCIIPNLCRATFLLKSKLA